MYSDWLLTIIMNGIRLARTTDLPSIEQIVHEAIQHMRAMDLDQWDEIYPDSETLMADIGKKEMSVICQNGKICGCITVNNEESAEYTEVDWKLTGTVSVIHRLTVAPMYQSQGFARQLMLYAEKLACDRGSDIIRLDAFSHNRRALQFYERLGYSKSGSVQFRKGRFFCYEKALDTKDL